MFKIKKLISLTCVLLLAVFALGITEAQAESFPEDDIEIIVPWSAGGGTDVTARALAGPLEEVLGVNVTVTNMPGASGETGYTELAHSEPDGYTLGFINTPQIILHPMTRDTDYTLEDIQPLANIVYDPGAIAVSKDSEIETLSELVEYGQENPITYGTSGVGGDEHIAIREMAKLTDSKFTHVPFEGGAPAITAAMGNHVTAVSVNFMELIPYHEEELRILAVENEERLDDAPDIPTFEEELGITIPIDYASARALSAPVGISEEREEILVNAILEALETDAFKEQAEELDFQMRIMDSDELSDYINEITPGWEDAWEDDPWM